MHSRSRRPDLIAIRLEDLRLYPLPAWIPRPQQAIITGESTKQEHSFRFETGPLNDQQLERCLVLQRHGFTVVEFSDEGHWFHRSIEHWQESMIQKAMNQVAAIYEGREEDIDMTAYDPELTKSVLEAAARAFPKQLTIVELKREIAPEPSDPALMTAIEALFIDNLLEGPELRDGVNNALVNVGYIRITGQGRKYLAEQSQPHTSSSGSVIHGDQINNYGPVGAVGRNAQGVVNVYERWTGIEQQVNLHTLATQLEQLRAEYRKTATTREDDKQVALLADAAEAAEKGDGKGMAEFLSRVGKGVLDKAQDIGTDIAAKVIVRLATGD